MLDKWGEIEKRYKELAKKLSSPEVLADKKRYRQYAKAHSELTPLVNKIKEYRKVLADLKEVKELLREEKEPEMLQFLQEELATFCKHKQELEESLKKMLIGAEPLGKKNIIMEIRAGAGGEEASLFAADLYRMYSRYAQSCGWRAQVLSATLTDRGGFKEIIFEIKGEAVYSRLKYESGVHRVQRVPVTESGGRIHTSTATVAVLPQAEEVEVEIDPKTLRIETYRAAGPGGQHVNVTDSAVRITHKPSKIVVSCQQERSQFQNKERAMRILRARLYEQLRKEKEQQLAETRRLQVGAGKRSEKIRTYNFPQNRVTDHRLGLTLYNLESVLEGNLEEIIEVLAANQAPKKA